MVPFINHFLRRELLAGVRRQTDWEGGGREPMVGRPGLSPHEWILPLRKEEGARQARGAGRSITLSTVEGQAR